MHLNISSLIFVDYAVLTVIAVSMIFGFYSGFIQSFLGFFAWIAAMIGSLISSPIAVKLLEGHIKSQLLLDTCAIFGSFILFLVLIILINNFIIKLLNPLRKGVIDIALGGLFGVVRGCFLSCVLFWVWLLIINNFSNGEEPEWLSKASSARALKIGTLELIEAADSYATNESVAKYIKSTSKYIKLNSADEKMQDDIHHSADDLFETEEIE